MIIVIRKAIEIELLDRFRGGEGVREVISLEQASKSVIWLLSSFLNRFLRCAEDGSVHVRPRVEVKRGLFAEVSPRASISVEKRIQRLSWW